MSFYPKSIPRCEHIKTNGTQCGSPALRRNHFCYFHKRWRDTRVALNANRARRSRAALDLPVLEDAESVQVSLMQVMRMILSGQLEPKTAGLLLYALQTASSNLRRTHFEPFVTHVVIDPSTVDETVLGEDPWRPEDFLQRSEPPKSLPASAQHLNEDDSDEEALDEEALNEDDVDEEEASPEETIANIEARAGSGLELKGKHEQTMVQIKGMVTAAIRGWLAAQRPAQLKNQT
jgi:hypothetical protein